MVSRCPECGEVGVRVVYGGPTPEMVEAADRGEVALGGCTVDPGVPSHVCPVGHSWDRDADGWPSWLDVDDDNRVPEGLVVRSRSGEIEGRTTGAPRRRCAAKNCPGWFLTVSWETGQLIHICSQGWAVDPGSRNIRVTGGGEISARFVSPPPLGTPPLPPEQWPAPEQLTGKGWRINPKHARTRSDALRRVDEHVARIAAMTGSELDEYVAGIEAETAVRDPQDLLDEAAARKQWKYRRN